MTTSQQTVPVSVVAGSAVTIYRFVALAADGQYDHAGDEAQVYGVAAETIATAGDALSMLIPNGSIIKVEAGAAITIQDKIASDATGRAVTATGGVGKFSAGKALDAATGAGEIIRVQFLVDEDQVA